LTAQVLTAPALLAWVFLSAEEPFAEEGWQRLRALWIQLGARFGMDQAIPALDVPAGLSDSPPADQPRRRRLVAAAESGQAGIWQAALRHQNRVWCLSVMLAPPRPGDGTDTAQAWARLRDAWPDTGDGPGHLGETLAFLGLYPDGTAVADVTAAALGAVPGPALLGWPGRRDLLALPGLAGQLCCWEIGTDRDDGRPRRRLLLLAPAAGESAADALAWTTGDGELPPLGRHLLAASALRYEIRVFDDGEVSRRLRQARDDYGVAFPARWRAEAQQLRKELERMRFAVNRLGDNLRTGGLEGPGSGPFADDLWLASMFPRNIADEIEALDLELTAPGEDPARPVVILTALGLEYAALRERLVGLRVDRDSHGTIFEVGTLPGGGRPIVLAEIGPGNQTAAVLTERAAARFKPEALLFVGVAGSLKADIRIGDVVVATKVYFVHGGKEEDQGFLSRPRAWDAPYRLEQLARYVSRSGRWPSAVHLKPIAAGEVVLNSRTSPLARMLRERYNDAGAIEMEGAGVARAAHLNGTLPALIIRGISDAADGGKSAMDESGSQPLAAANAAAFALALVAAL